MSISIAFQTNKPLAAYGPLAQKAEFYGFDGVTVYNDMLYQPAWLPLLEIARATKHVRLGPAAVNPYTCHPVNIASQIALLDEASNGRAYLGIARGAWLDFVGVSAKRPITTLREAFTAVRHLLRQSKEPLAGEIFPLAGGDALRWEILRPDIPFLLGSWGLKTIAACAPHVQEVKLGGTANPDVVRWLKGTFPNLDIVVGAVTVVDEDGAGAKALAKREVALYLPVIANLDPTISIEPDRLAGLEAAAKAFDFEAASRFVSDELLQRFAFAGTPAEVATQTNALLAAGSSRVEFGTPHGKTAEIGLQLLGSQVLPAIEKKGA